MQVRLLDAREGGLGRLGSRFGAGLHLNLLLQLPNVFHLAVKVNAVFILIALGSSR